MRIVVTGAAGFIGSHLCEQLANLGHQVIGIDSFNEDYPVSIKEQNVIHMMRLGVKLERLDLACDSLETALSNADMVYHLAAQSGLSSHVSPAMYRRNNPLATEALLKACSALSFPPFFVHISTSSVYGRCATGTETSVVNPISDYGSSKLAAEQIALEYSQKNKVIACAMRLFSVYGPRERPEKLFMKLMNHIVRDKEFPLFEGSLDHKRSFTYVDDIIAGLVAIIGRHEVCAGEIFNIGSDTDTTTRQGIAIVEKLLKRKARIRILPPRPGDQHYTCAQIGKANSILGYTPRTHLEDGLSKQVTWHRQSLRGSYKP